MVRDNELRAAAKRIVEQGPGPWPAEDWSCLLALVHRAIPQLAHKTMIYKCDDCGFEWEVYLALGLEGPDELSANHLVLPVPFVAGTCEVWRPPPGEEPAAGLRNLKRCGGAMQHVRFQEDRSFAPSLIPDDAPRFVLPTSAAGGDAPCGRLEIPTPALVRARRAGSEN